MPAGPIPAAVLPHKRIIKIERWLIIMFHNLKRDFSKTLKQQIKEGTSKGWTYIGVFGRGENAILKFIRES